MSDKKEHAALLAESERLRELLEKVLVYSHSMPTTLVAAIKKEVGLGWLQRHDANRI